MLDRLAPFLGPDTELVVSDNGSCDDTGRVLQAFATRGGVFPLSISTNEVNLGADVNYLRVLEFASGTWLWMVGDDEAILPSAIPNLLRELHGRSGAILLSSPLPELPDLPTTAQLSFNRFLEARYDVFGMALLQIGRFVLERDAMLAHLRRAYSDGVGHLHAYAFLSLAAIKDGATLHVVPVAGIFPPVAEMASEQPRWNQLAGHVGAWRSSLLALDGNALARQRERRLRARAIIHSAIWHLNNGGRLGTALSLWMLLQLPFSGKAQMVPIVILDIIPTRARMHLLRLARFMTGRKKFTMTSSSNY